MDRLKRWGVFAVKWAITTSCLIGIVAIVVFLRVNIWGKEVSFALPEYPARIDYNYNDNAIASKKK